MGANARSGAAETVRSPRHDSAGGHHETRAVESSEGNGRLRLLRFPAVRHMTGLSRSTIWRLERAKMFPRHVRLSANTVAWLEEEVRDWIRRKVG